MWTLPTVGRRAQIFSVHLTFFFNLYIFNFFSSEDLRVLTIKHNKEKDEVKKNLTIKREKKKESVQRKLLEHERAATAALVEKHSQEMMVLIQEKRAQYVENAEEVNGTTEYPSHPPPPVPPSFAKIEIYK